ncbi:unnamed protein product [Didymodactylos carnosus]|uniref:F-box/LRR-repeat protein 15-like leucin rich repeat domain-containing protein n=1 Tax=Didymodactylos carnosus TaxID=1234261 RepID=A0A814H1J3_9BILA|nr:unnamed protein product [Didymodactylos carnosus]CAF1012742.1 unnamed protein product [Didymodactylos carnosus]CAF3775012.1 unnamed protein product [Didymodactylos carnosus]CAF3781588.1 unnamed protein product [Didymodactylos carnosus]
MSVYKLVDLSEYCIAKYFEQIVRDQLTTIRLLPVNLKVRLFFLLTQRGLIDDSNILVLLNSRTQVFDFHDCHITDETLSIMSKCSLNSQIERQRQISTTIDHQTMPVLNPTVVYINDRISDDGWIKFIHEYLNLRKIHLNNCPLITDKSLYSIGQCCHRLIELDLNGCMNISDEGIKELKCLLHIKSLGLAQTSITDMALYSIGQASFKHMLQEINVKQCQNITDDGFMYLLSNCPNLRTIGFLHCPKLTELSRQSLGPHTHQFSYVVWSIPV